MGQSYDDAAEAARDREAIKPYDVNPDVVKARLQNFLYTENPSKSGARKLIEETAERAMSQEIRSDAGWTIGDRENLKVWQDTWGNIMAHNTNTGTRKTIVPKEEL